MGCVERVAPRLLLGLTMLLHLSGLAIAQKPEPNMFAGAAGAVVCSRLELIQLYQSLIGDEVATQKFLARTRGDCEKVPPDTGYLLVRGAFFVLRRPGDVDLVYGAQVEWGPSKQQQEDLARRQADREARDRQIASLSKASFAPTRPPGITRSGDNDEFGRGVIKALMRTTPSLPREVVGRATVRLILDESGAIGFLEVTQPSGVDAIDRAVTSAIRGTSFFRPFRGSTAKDRTFIITYVFGQN